MRRPLIAALACIALFTSTQDVRPAIWSILTNPATTVTVNSAVLNGHIAFYIGGEYPVRFEIGTESGTYTAFYAADQSPHIGGVAPADYTYSLTGLTPGWTYHYRISIYYSEAWIPGDEESFTTDLPLSVGLAAFSGQAVARGILLTWATESECGNLGFGIDRREEASSEWTFLSDYTANPSLAGHGDASARTEYRYLDFTAMPGHCYEYRISDTDFDGKTTVRHEIRVVYGRTVLPSETRLFPAYPNPFNPETRISFSVTDDSNVSLSVLDSNGRVVRQLLSKVAKKAGAHDFTWNAMDDTGLPVPAGVYMILLQAGGLLQSQKVLYLR